MSGRSKTVNITDPPRFATAWLNVDLFTSRDDMRPAICAVRVEQHGNAFRLVATDAYRLAWSSTEPTELAATPQRAWSIQRDARTNAMMRRLAIRWTRHKNPETPSLSITFDNTDATFNLNDGEETLRIPLTLGEFPEWGSLPLGYMEDGERQDTQRFNPEKLLQFSKLRSCAPDCTTTIRLGKRANDAAVIEALCDPPLTALLMPVVR